MHITQLQKIAQFTTSALSEITQLREKLAAVQQTSETNQPAMDLGVLRKTAQVLYDADWLGSDREQRDFVKKASEDPAYLATMIQKLCAATDVLALGTPSGATLSKQAAEDFDPVAARAFGRSTGTGVQFDE